MAPVGKPNVVSENPSKFSYLNYAKQTQDLWNGFQKPIIIGECGYDHTHYEVGTPGYLEMYHNTLWAGLANGLSMTPFWWANGPYINDAVFTRKMSCFAAFVRGIDLAKSDYKPVVVKMSEGDGWAMQSDTLTFGWAVNPLNGVARKSMRVPGQPDGEYDFHLYRPWRGVYMPVMAAESKGGELTVQLPELRAVVSRAQSMGNDVAFKIVKKGSRLTAGRSLPR